MSLFLPSITISVKENVGTYDRPWLYKHGFCTRKMGKEYYLYQKPEDEWIKSVLLLVSNPINNIFCNCIVLLVESLPFLFVRI